MTELLSTDINLYMYNLVYLFLINVSQSTVAACTNPKNINKPNIYFLDLHIYKFVASFKGNACNLYYRLPVVNPKFI